MSLINIYSKSLRIRVVAAVDRSTPRREVVETFCVSLTTLKQWLKMRREGKDLSPRQFLKTNGILGAVVLSRQKLSEWLVILLLAACSRPVSLALGLPALAPLPLRELPKACGRAVNHLESNPYREGKGQLPGTSELLAFYRL